MEKQAEFPVSFAKFRTKTGCLGCRARRKKCDEARPRCSKCSKAGDNCVWPSAEQRLDRRHRNRKHVSISHVREQRQASVTHATEDKFTDVLRTSRLPGTLDNIAVEAAVLEHFTSSFLPLLFLSMAHPRFRDDALAHSFYLSPIYRHLEITMLACGAMHMRAVSSPITIPKTPIHYYSDAVAAVSRAVQDIPSVYANFHAFNTFNDSYDALIVSIILLYIYGTWTADVNTNRDRCHHVGGATQLLKIRYYQPAKRFPLRVIDRLMIESVLFQHFLLSARHPFSTDTTLDAEFWMSMEAVLSGTGSHAVLSIADQPILGILISLYRLILNIIQLNRSNFRKDSAIMAATQEEVTYWEGFIGGHTNQVEDSSSSPISSTETTGLYNALVVEYVLAASLMLSWIAKADPRQEIHPLSIKAGESWQLRRAMHVVQHMTYRDEWTSCYLGMWPLLIFGYAAEAETDVALITEDLKRRRDVVGMGETVAIRSELENLWDMRRRRQSWQ